MRGFTRNKAQRHKVRDKGKEGWLGVDYVPGVVASGGWVCLEWWRDESKLCPWRGEAVSGTLGALVSLWLKNKYKRYSLRING